MIDSNETKWTSLVLLKLHRRFFNFLVVFRTDGAHHGLYFHREKQNPSKFLPNVTPTPWKINMEPTNHPFRKENDLPNLHDSVPAVNLPGRIAGGKNVGSPIPPLHSVLVRFIGCQEVEVSEFWSVTWA